VNKKKKREMGSETKKACVVGGSGYLGSMLIKHLLQNGYSVNCTVRNPDNKKKIPHLLALKEVGVLEIFKADLTDEGSFDAPVAGCQFVFQVATPINLASQDPEKDMVKPAIEGVLNVMKACVQAQTVKRFIYTSSAAAITVNSLEGTGIVVDENNWSDVEFLTSTKPPTWGYPLSKTLAEKEVLKFAEENKFSVVTVIPVLMAGSKSLTPDVPSSIGLATSLMTGNEFHLKAFKGMQMLSGSISVVHVEDVCRAHIFLAEKETASGRYVCCAENSSIAEIAKFLTNRYPQYKVTSDLGDFPSKAKLIVSSKKLIEEGFDYKYGIEEIYDQTLEYAKANGMLK
jgi:anthocyanidin reductase